jgi:hypothetical protein
MDNNIDFEYGAGVPSSLTVYLKAETESLGATPFTNILGVKVELCDDTATLISSAVESLSILKDSTFTAIDLSTKFSMVKTYAASACTGTHTIALSSTATTQTALTGLASTQASISTNNLNILTTTAGSFTFYALITATSSLNVASI